MSAANEDAVSASVTTKWIGSRARLAKTVFELVRDIKLAKARRFRRARETRALPRICRCLRWRCGICSLLFGRSGFQSRRCWQMPGAQFFDIRKLVQVVQAEVVEKELGRHVKQGPSGNFGATGNFHQAAFHQCLQNAIDGHAANSL